MMDIAFRRAQALHEAGCLAEADRAYRSIQPSPDLLPDWLHLRGTLAAQFGRPAEGAALILEALKLRPGTPTFLWNLAQALTDAGDRSGAVAAWCAVAEALLRTDPAGVRRAANAALAVQPDHRLASSYLAAGLFLSGERDQGEAMARANIAHPGAPPEAFNHLANMLLETQRPEEALAYYDRAIALRPGHAATWHDRALAREQLGDRAGAIADIDVAIRTAPGSAEYLWHKGLVKLALGEMEEGWTLYEERLRYHGFEHADRGLPIPLWTGGDLRGGRLLVWAEQGFGDTLQFIRLAPMLAERGIRVVLEVQRILFPLIWQSLAGTDVLVIPRTDDPARVDQDLGLVAHVPLMSLPHRLGLSLTTIPPPWPLVADPARVARWQRHLPPGRCIGLAWAGRPKPHQERSIPEAALAPLFDLPDITWVSLQKGDAAERLAALQPKLVQPDDMHDFAESAALASCCELVISADTAAAHLAGGLGVPCWTLLPHVAEWRWLEDRADSPWYPGMRLFRQPRRGDWEGVIARVAAELGRAC